MSRTACSRIPTRPRRCVSCPSTTTRSLGFADRSRILPSGTERPFWKGAVLVDGFAAGTWRFDRGGDEVAIEVSAWRKLTRPERAEVEAEAAALLDWAQPATRTEVRIVAGGVA